MWPPSFPFAGISLLIHEMGEKPWVLFEALPHLTFHRLNPLKLPFFLSISPVIFTFIKIGFLLFLCVCRNHLITWKLPKLSVTQHCSCRQPGTPPEPNRHPLDERPPYAQKAPPACQGALPAGLVGLIKRPEIQRSWKLSFFFSPWNSFAVCWFEAAWRGRNGAWKPYCMSSYIQHLGRHYGGLCSKSYYTLPMALALAQSTGGSSRKVGRGHHSCKVLLGEAVNEKEGSMEHHKCILPHVKTFFWQVMSLTFFSLQKMPKSTIHLAACY